MFSKNQLINMNYSKNYSSFGYIKNNMNELDDNKLYKLYATNNTTLSGGREHIAFPSNQILKEIDYIKYNLMK